MIAHCIIHEIASTLVGAAALAIAVFGLAIFSTATSKRKGGKCRVTRYAKSR